MATRRRTVGALVGVAFLASASVALAAGSVGFYGRPGTNPPPRKLHKLRMKQFPTDGRADNSMVRSVSAPTGKIHFSVPLQKRTAGSSWSQWGSSSNNYTGSVYDETGTTVTLTLPAGTRAFYLYAEPYVISGSYPITVKANGGASSGPVEVLGADGATYFGFFAKTKKAAVERVTVHAPASAGGFGIGEFGIH